MGNLRPPRDGKADPTKVGESLTRQSTAGVELASNTGARWAWSKVCGLSHPTEYAADDSIVVVSRMTRRPGNLNIRHERAGARIGVSRVMMAVLYDLPSWIPLGLDGAHMPAAEFFWRNADQIAAALVFTGRAWG
jgi:hypothetical protein